MTTHAEPKPPTTVLNRISTLLDAFDGRGQLTLNEVVEYTGFPRSLAHRMLDSLVKLRWVRRDGQRYGLGMRLVELGSLAVHQARLHRVALPSLHELHRLTGHVVHLAVLDGPDIVCLEMIGGRTADAIPTRVGGRLPAHCTGSARRFSAAPTPPNYAPLLFRCYLAARSIPSPCGASFAGRSSRSAGTEWPTTVRSSSSGTAVSPHPSG